MKAMIVSVLGILASAIFIVGLMNQKAEAQTAKSMASPGMPPIGRIVEISLSAWSYGQMPTPTTQDRKVTGTLVAMTDRWVVVQEGSYENWVPMERVVVMRASR